MDGLDLNEKLREMKLQEIAVYLNKFFPKVHHTREDALNLIVEHFYDRFFDQIQKANEEHNNNS